jgi:ABC-type uncharacterized transport system ATPase subunit
MTGPVLRLQGICKRFGTLQANADISLELGAGEVLALLGENGAGKSTLVSILFGHYEADAGRIEVFGRPLPPGQPKAALDAGIGMVHQHSTLADNLSVLDNVMLGTEPWWRPWSAREGARRRLLDTARRFGLPVQPDARVAGLSVGERQRVEILKALVRGARILILDEPTAVLTPQEGEALFATLSQMVAQGLSIIFISHKLEEVLRVSHRVAVLRAGVLVASAPTREVTLAQLALWMVGREVRMPARAPARGRGELVARLSRACAGQGRAQLREPTSNCMPARSSPSRASPATASRRWPGCLGGTLACVRGEALFLGRPLTRPIAALVADGLARIPEDRHGTGVIGDLPLWENAVAERLRSPAFSRRAGGVRWVRREAARAYARELVEAFDVRGAGQESPVRALSGGNMQKLILGRALRAPDARVPRLVVAHQPTWGLDIGAVAHVQQQLIGARDAGAAVLLISDDLDEVLTLGDRVAVMHEGRVSPAMAPERWTRESLGLAMAGSAVAA